MPKATGLVLAAVLAAGGVGCNRGVATEVIVSLSADASFSHTAATLHVEIENDDGAIVLARDKTIPAGALELARIPLVPKNGDPTRRFRLAAKLLDAAGTPLAYLRAEAGYRDGELGQLNLAFTKECARHDDCGAGRTCDLGRCVGDCFDPGDATHVELDRPTCGECERCANACVAADGAACGCPGETCSGASCVPRTRVLLADAGSTHTCAALDDGTTWCWGSTMLSGTSGPGLLGTGPDGVDSPKPVEVSGATCRRALTATGGHTCCSGIDARYCWGENEVGELGGDIGNLSATPHRFQDPFALEALASGFRHTCGLTGDGRLFCWGYNERGNLGIGTTTQAELTPVEVGDRYAQVAAGGDHTCGVTTSGELRCWGYNDSNELGVPGADSPAPLRSGCEAANAGTACFDDWIAVGTGAFHTCGIRSSGDLYCWGGNQNGQLGIGPPTNSFQESEPHRIQSNELWADVAGGRSYTCALTRLGALYCWGLNEDRQLGIPEVDFVNAPAAVVTDAPGGFRQLGLGDYHACAIRADRTLWCWGRNRDGQVGIGVTSETPVERPARVCF
jgi:alpha-tubulin suppressor-like RCC1 family protein